MFDFKPNRQQILESVTVFADDLMRSGMSDALIQNELVSRGIDPEDARIVVGNLRRENAAAMLRSAHAAQHSGRRNMIWGALWCVGGSAVTVGTYLATSHALRGPGALVAWGAIVFGAIQFAGGIVHSR